MADSFEKDFMRVMREKAAAKALLDPEQFKPDQSITNEQAKAMNLPEADVREGYDYDTRESFKVAASPVGGETPEEAYQTSLKMASEAGGRQSKASDDIGEVQNKPGPLFKALGLATGGDRLSDGEYYIKRPDNFTELARDLLSLETQGVAQFDPKFKKQLEDIVGPLLRREKSLQDKYDKERKAEEDLRQSAKDIDELLLTDKSKK